MHDNTLVRALNQLACDATLVPTYTPIRTDESDISVDRVFFGGINVYLQQKIPIFRWLPAFMDRFLDNPKLIRRMTARSIDMAPAELGKLAISMLRGLSGNQRKEVKRLSRWLKLHEKPEMILLTNLLIGGAIPFLKQELGVPIVVTLQGDDVFLDSLLEEDRARCKILMREISQEVDAFICHSNFYREFMADYLGINREKIFVTRLGIDTDEFAGIKRQQLTSSTVADLTICYLARLAPEKGLHLLVDAFIDLHERLEGRGPKLIVAGWLSKQNAAYANEQFEKLAAAQLSDQFQHLGVIDRVQKVQMLAQTDLFCVPATYLEPKGLYALEAMAAGAAVVAPDHGAFPEMIDSTGGGLLFRANDTADLSCKLEEILVDHGLRHRLAQQGRQAVISNRNALAMGRDTLELLNRLRNPNPRLQ
ncbi:MAG TPA: glycosyltransferase family 4 protein [Pirellulaceae bacterium]|nr:glycosyltransferase family 4 protein [Pirellulaceae bacterium]HMO93293.1 glycosyltransferase family 4 protein [Pirellulaceae bacterium]HMP70167.1 glycosyltransferase family 4 protein [Pirellulaceae bacterium]